MLVVPLYDLSPAAYQRVVNDLVNLVGAVLGYVQQRGGQGLAQAVAAEAGAILMGYDEDVAERVQRTTNQELVNPPKLIPGRELQIKDRRACRFHPGISLVSDTWNTISRQILEVRVVYLVWLKFREGFHNAEPAAKNGMN